MGCGQVILLDTHTLIWLDAGLHKLGTGTREQLDHALQDERLIVSAISFWEVGMLVNKGRLQLDIDMLQWRSELLAGGLREIAVTGRIAIEAAGFGQFHGDPADRMIVATAIQEDALLATADGKILGWHGPVQCLDARR